MRLLGIRASGRSPRQSVIDLVDEELDQGQGLLGLEVVLRNLAVGLPGSDAIDHTGPTVIGVCTIGGALERRVDRLLDDGETARAMVLDAIGSAAVEALANQCNHIVCRYAAGCKRGVGPRRSPGYGRWKIEEQRLIFELLRPEQIGVTLTAGCMMVPRKSISFLVPLTGDAARRVTPRGCARCGLEGCEFRSEHADPDEDDD